MRTTILTDGSGTTVEFDGPRLGPATGSGDRSPTPGLESMRLLPGFIDVQVNGAFGIDLQARPDRIGELGARLPEVGVTSWCPTLVTGPPSRIDAGLEAWADHRSVPPSGVIAEPIGWHLEGPCISEARLGAHPARWRRDPADIDTSTWSRRDGVSLVTLAPELPGARGLIERLHDADVVVSIGHTDARADEVVAGVRAGATMLTHLGNAMRPFHHREPGPIGVGLTDPALSIGLIADGVHVHPTTVALAFAAAADRVVLVSDAVAPAGLPGSSTAGHRLDDGTLAGATALLDAVVAAHGGVTAPFDDVVAAATRHPARLLGLADRGRLEPGLRADVVLWDPEADPGHHVVATWVAGRRHPTGSLPVTTV